MKITKSEYVRAREDYVLDLDEDTMKEINNDLHKECKDLANFTISKIDIVSVILYDGLEDQAEYSFNRFGIEGDHVYQTSIEEWIRNWFDDVIYQVDYDTEVYDYDDSEISVELENDQDYIEWLKLNGEDERILLFSNNHCEEFFNMQEAANFIYKNSIKSCRLQHEAAGMIYYQLVENPDRYWLNKFGVPYQELFDEDPDADSDE